MKFALPKQQSSIIKVIGVGGGGSNAVNHMFKQGITGVDFIVCNTDSQHLERSPVPNKIQLGANLTEGRGAGSLPEIGRKSAIESIEEIKKFLTNNTKMVFITAGMGGGTGTGAAPVISAAAREMGILTVGIVTVPFLFEGKRRMLQANGGLDELQANVDSLLIICNDKLGEIYGNLTLTQAFAHADDVLTTAAKGIAEIITVPGYINVDFEDVKKVLTNSGVAIMGSAHAEGENRAIKAVELALTSPLLNDNHIIGAKDILLNITSGSNEVTMNEVAQITNYIQEEAGMNAEMIWGNGTDESLGDKISVTIIATGFKSGSELKEQRVKPKKIIIPFNEEVGNNPKEATPLSPLESSEPVLKTTPQNKPERVQSSITFVSKQTINPPVEETNQLIRNNPEKGLSLQKPEFQKKETKDFLIKKSEERIIRLKDLSMKLKTPSGVADLEKEPAYKRRNIELKNIPHSSQSHMSRYTLEDESSQDDAGGKKDIQIRPNNNSFLHDNVD